MATHTLTEIIETTIKTAILKCHPVGSFWLTVSDDDPNEIFGGTWERVKGKLLQCSDDSHPAGTDIAAGLPNITGFCKTVGDNANSSWTTNMLGGGAFVRHQVWDSQAFTNCVTNSKDATAYLDFDASKSNPIYGASDTVQPETHVVNVWQRTA